MFTTTTLTLLLAVLGASAQITSPVAFNTLSRNHTCAIQSKYPSCENTTAIVDTCCSPVQGLVLTTQFWSTYTGFENITQKLPPKSWSIHGLWPDKCDGSYGQYCDLSRQYDPAPSPAIVGAESGFPNGTVVPAFKGGDIFTPLLQYFGKYDMLEYMKRFWVNQGAPNYVFWQHEFAKHATCFSTFDVGYNGTNNCYGPTYQQGEDVVSFLETAIAANIKYPTYDWLAAANILPSNTTTYNLTAIQSALTKASGAVPYLGCSGPTGNKTVLSEVWYYAHSIGTPQDLNYKPVNQTGSSSCSMVSPIMYPLRSTGSEF